MTMQIHGPMWQAECGRCKWLGDAWGNVVEAERESVAHQCLDHLLRGGTVEVLDELGYTIAPKQRTASG